HVPLLPETHHLFGPRIFSSVKRRTILVNTARGPVVDGKALLGALDSGTVSAAGLDVFEEEPLPLDSPLRKHPRVVLTDNIAWDSEESQAELKATAAEELVRVCTGGLPRSLANPEVLERLGRMREWPVPNNVRWRLLRAECLGKGSDVSYKSLS